MAKYLIRPGASFRMPDGSLKTGGEEIELDSDVANIHAGLITPIPQEEQPADAAALPAAASAQ